MIFNVYGMNRLVQWILILSILGVIHRGQCAFFDYTDFDDPFQLLWNAKNQVAREPNSPCLANIGNIPLEGVCKSHTECQLTRGVFGGSCGLLSTCCVYMGGCGSKLSARISYFQNIGTSNRQSCTYQVQLHNRNICQLRLDFLHMTLAPPAQADPYKGTCRDEKFFIEGYTNIPQFCGKNTGQHMYIPVNGNDTTPVKFHIDLIPEILIQRGWTIKITQLHCPGTSIFPYRTQIMAMARDFPLLAPQNCLQYFTDLKGSFKSFGYDMLAPDTSTYNVNQSYAICFKRHSGVCGISYTPDYFKVGTNPIPATGPDDYLYIPALQTSDTLKDERVSGQLNVNRHFTSVTPGPLYVYFKSDSDFKTDQDLGFNIKYDLSTVCP